jgi:hypothetical protein
MAYNYQPKYVALFFLNIILCWLIKYSFVQNLVTRNLCTPVIALIDSNENNTKCINELKMGDNNQLIN